MVRLILLFSLLALCSLLNAESCSLLDNAVTPAGFCARKWATGLATPRGIMVLSNNDVLVVERGKGQITLLYETTKLNTVVLASASGINHGITFGGGYLYASSPDTVYRWPYTVGTRKDLGKAQAVITGIPPNGHNTRTLVYDNGNLIVSVGSNGNIDTSGQGAIYRFQISSFPTTFGSSKTVVASGVRNEVGLRFDATGRLWGVENGLDDVSRSDLGGDIHNQNPGEELNLFAQDGKFYGYPYCWSAYNLTPIATPRLTQYALASFMNDGTHTDAWCQNENNVVLPKYAMRAHTAPLDILFYNGGTNFPSADGNAFVALHGSWDRQPAAGYSVVQVTFQNGMPVADTNLLTYKGPGETGNGWIRPAGLAWYNGANRNTTLLVTDDTNGLIVAVAYETTCPCNAPIPGGSSSTTDSSVATTISPSLRATLSLLCLSSLLSFLLLN